MNFMVKRREGKRERHRERVREKKEKGRKKKQPDILVIRCRNLIAVSINNAFLQDWLGLGEIEHGTCRCEFCSLKVI